MKDPTDHPPIEEQLKRLPASPGVYLMKAPDGAILYIGKAANLRSLVGWALPTKINSIFSSLF